MDMLEYSSKANRTAPEYASWKDQIHCALLGLQGETGEVADHYKKHFYQGHELNPNKILDELGDILWYINLLADANGFNLDDIAEYNIEKLRKRYKEGFTVHESVNRQ